MPKRHRQPEPIESFESPAKPPPRSDSSFSSPPHQEKSPSKTKSTEVKKSSPSNHHHSAASNPPECRPKVGDSSPSFLHSPRSEKDADNESPSEKDFNIPLYDENQISSESPTSDSCVDYDSDEVGDDGNQHDDADDDFLEDDDDEGSFFDEEEEVDVEVANDKGEDDDRTGSESVGGDRDHVDVDFGVYDMQLRQVDAVMHLIDQFCPDKMNEIDRDAFGAALAANPLTCIVKLNDLEGDDEDSAGDIDNGKGEKEEEEEEVYGLASAFDVAHELHSHPMAFKPLCEIIKSAMWRVVSPGIPPTDFLLSTTSSTPSEGQSTRRCLLLVMEYVRNVPLELTVEILEDLVRRVEEEQNNGIQSPHCSAGKKNSKNTRELATPCGFAVLAKIQRAKQVSADKTPNADKSRKSNKKARDSHEPWAADGKAFDLSQFIFWREEDDILFRHRDQRIATWAYRCRPQYVEQPTQEIPLSLLFIIQPESMKKAIGEIKKHASAPANIVRF